LIGHCATVDDKCAKKFKAGRESPPNTSALTVAHAAAAIRHTEV
jgi:hypothetical protein